MITADPSAATRPNPTANRPTPTRAQPGPPSGPDSAQPFGAALAALINGDPSAAPDDGTATSASDRGTSRDGSDPSDQPAAAADGAAAAAMAALGGITPTVVAGLSAAGTPAAGAPVSGTPATGAAVSATAAAGAPVSGPPATGVLAAGRPVDVPLAGRASVDPGSDRPGPADQLPIPVADRPESAVDHGTAATAAAQSPAPTQPATTTLPAATALPVAAAPALQPTGAAPAVAPPTAADPPRDLPAHQPELVGSLVRLRGGPEGVHELSISLHPAELGAVQIRATLHAGTLDVTVACADEGARQAVTAALPNLHQQLGSLGSVDVRVGAGPEHDPLGDSGAPPRQDRQRPDEDASRSRDRDSRDEHEEGFERWM